MTNTRVCHIPNCNRPGILNLATAHGGGGGPDKWICAQHAIEGFNSPKAIELSTADEEAEDFKAGGGKLS